MDRGIATFPEIISSRVIVFESCWSTRFHKTPAHELLHVLDGNFELTYEDGRRFFGAKGDTFLVHTGISHKDVFKLKRDLKILLIHFCWPEQEELLNSIDNSRINRMDSRLRSELRWLFEHMREDLGSGELEQALENTRLATALLLIHKGIHTKSIPEAECNSHHELILAAKEYVKRNYGSHLTLDEIADHLQVSPWHLSRLFKQECCFNLFEYVEEVRIEEAQKLLRDGRFRVSEVAAITGFENSNYFSKIFHKKVGVSPGKFR